MGCSQSISFFGWGGVILVRAEDCALQVKNIVKIVIKYKVISFWVWGVWFLLVESTRMGRGSLTGHAMLPGKTIMQMEDRNIAPRHHLLEGRFYTNVVLKVRTKLPNLLILQYILIHYLDGDGGGHGCIEVLGFLMLHSHLLCLVSSGVSSIFEGKNTAVHHAIPFVKYSLIFGLAVMAWLYKCISIN